MSEMVVPDGWDIDSLGNFAEKINRRNSAANKNVLTISAQHGLINQKEFFNKYVASKNLSNYFHLFKGEFAYNKSYSAGYPVGVVRKLKKYDEGVLSPLYICFSLTSNKFNNVFAEYFFNSDWFVKEINFIAKEGARNHGLLNVGVSDFFNLAVLLPPLPEQKKIASILTSVDDVIEKTQSQINKLQDLKKGTMNVLLTRGIGHTEFKDSPVGRIPKGWEVEIFGEFIKLTSGKSKPKNQLSSTNDKTNPVPVFGGNGITGYTNIPLLDQQTIAIGRVGEYCGSVHLTPELSWITDNALYINQLESGYNLLFLFFLMDHAEISKLRSMTGQPLVTQKPIYGLSVGIPPLPEQQKIASILSAIDTNIEEKQRKLEQTKSLKKSLMQDLLTGKVRVTIN